MSLDTKVQVHDQLEGCGSSGKFEPHFHEENGSEQEKGFGRVIYASETTGHIDTLTTLLIAPKIPFHTQAANAA